MRETLWILSSALVFVVVPPVAWAQFPGPGNQRPQGRPGLPPGNGGFDPFGRNRPGIPGMPGGFHVPTLKHALNDPRNGSPAADPRLDPANVPHFPPEAGPSAEARTGEVRYPAFLEGAFLAAILVLAPTRLRLHLLQTVQEAKGGEGHCRAGPFRCPVADSAWLAVSRGRGSAKRPADHSPPPDPSPRGGNGTALHCRSADFRAMRCTSLLAGGVFTAPGPVPGEPDSVPSGGRGQGSADGPPARRARRADAVFNPWALRAWIAAQFPRIKQCWQERAYDPLRELLMPGLYARHEELLRAMRCNGEINRLDDLNLRRLEFVHVFCPKEADTHEVTALITFDARVSFVHDRTGAFLRGSQKVVPYQEFWIFRRQGDTWRLQAIEQSHESDRLQAANRVATMTDENLRNAVDGLPPVS